MKRITSILLAMMLLLTLSVSAMAAPVGTAGEITVKNVVDRTELDVYQILTYTYDSVTETYNTVGFNAGYQAVFLAAINSYDSGAYAMSGTPTAQEILLYITNTAALQTSTFAKYLGEALETYIKDNGPIATYAQKTSTDVATNGAYTFTSVAPGYYLIIDKTAYGTDEKAVVAVMLQPMAPGIVVTLKSDTYPPVIKVADADSYFIGDTVAYTITLPVPQFQTAGGTIASYVVTDTLDAALDRPSNAAASFTVTMAGTPLVYGTGYTVTYGATANTIVFDFIGLTVDDYIAAMGKNIVIKFNATINDKAPVEEGIVNEVFENDYFGLPRYDEEEVFTYGFKFNKTDEKDTFLPGMTFKLYEALEDPANPGSYLGNRTDYASAPPLTFTWDTAAGGYRYDDVNGDSKIITLANFATTLVYGLKEGVYVLIEDTADGYTVLNPITITLPDGQNLVYDLGKIVNVSGIELPGTGGIGTVLFPIIGGAIILGGGVLLFVNRKRVFGK